MKGKNYTNIISSSLLFIGAMILLGFFCFRFSVSARELRMLEYVNDNVKTNVQALTASETANANTQILPLHEILKEYHFSAQIQRNERKERCTEFVPFGVWDNEEHGHADIPGDYVITRITGDGRKGTIGAWYYNVGTYQGKTVDLKCTIADYMQKAGPNDTSGSNLGWIAMSAEQLGVYIRHLQWADVKLEFYDADTGNPLTIQSTAVLTDIDKGEGVMLLSEYDNWQVTQSSRLQIMDTSGRTSMDQGVMLWEKEQRSANDEAKDSWAQVQVMFQGFAFQYRMYSKLGMDILLESAASEAVQAKTAENMILNGNIERTSESGGVNGPEPPEFMFHFQGYSDCRLGPLTTGDGVLTAEDSDEIGKDSAVLYHRDEDFVYEMAYTVSPEYKNWYYDSFTVCAQLPKEMEFFSGEVYTADGKRVSDQFFIRESGGMVYFEAKKVKQESFYGKTYTFAVNGNVKQDADLADSWNGEVYSLPLFMQILIERNGKTEEKRTNPAYINLSAEYINGTVTVTLKDVLSGAVLSDGEAVLMEWDENTHSYQEVQKALYDKEKEGYEFLHLTKDHKNQGKYKVSVSRIPEHYLGIWEQEIEVKKNDAVFEVTGKHQPTGNTLIRMTSKIIRSVDGKEAVSEEYDSQNNAVKVCGGDTIQYHIYVERDSALTYKSGELLVKNMIPKGLLYEKASLNLIGEIQHPVENSTAKIASVLLNKEGELTWKINYLDEGEIAHVIFEVQVPQNMPPLSEAETKRYVNYAKLIENDQITASNVLEHQMETSSVALSMTASPKEDVTIHPRDGVQYTMYVKNTTETTLERVLVRMKIPEGMLYEEGSLSCERKNVQLYAVPTDENDLQCEFIYGVISDLLPNETVSVHVKLWVANGCQQDTAEVFGEIYEGELPDEEEWDPYQYACAKDSFRSLGSICHRIEKYPDIEPPRKDTPNETEQNQNNPKEESSVILPEEESEEENDTGNTAAGDVNENTSDNSEAVRTGDASQMEWYLLLAGAAILAFIFGFYLYRCRKRTCNKE